MSLVRCAAIAVAVRSSLQMAASFSTGMSRRRTAPLFVLPENEGENDGRATLTGRMPTDPAAPDTHPPEEIEAQSFRAMQKLTHP